MTARRCVLDTSVVILLRDGDEAIQGRLQGIEDLLVSAISLAELEGGVYRDLGESRERRARLDILLARFEIVPFDGETARVYGQIVQQNGFSRSRVIDRMIAAHALQEKVALATCNARDFRDIQELHLEDWSS